MVDKVTLNAGSLRSEAGSVLKSNLKRVGLRDTPRDVQEDVIREYIQAKDYGNLETDKGDFNEFIDDRGNELTKSIIKEIDNGGYSSWQEAAESEVMEYYSKSNVSAVVDKLQRDINKHLDSVDLTSELGSKAQHGGQVTISSLKKLGAVLKKIIDTLGAKSLWLTENIVESGIRIGRVFGTQMILIGCLGLVLGPLFLGAAAGPMTGIKCAGFIAAYTAAGAGLRVGCQKMGKKLGMNLGRV